MMTSKAAVAVFLTMLSFCVLVSAEDLLSRDKRYITDQGIFGLNLTIFTNVSDDLSITCGGVDVDISVSQAYLDTLDIRQVAEIRAIDENGTLYDSPACGVANSGQDYLQISLDEYFGQCSYKMESYAEYVLVIYSLCVVPEVSATGISRDSIEFIHFTCKYNRDLKVSLGTGLSPVIGQEKIVAGPAYAQLDLFMARFTDANFSAISDEDHAAVGDKIYVGVWLPQMGDYDFILRGYFCWATPTPSPHGYSAPVRYYMVAYGCPWADDMVSGANEVFENFHSNRLLFSFTGFYWKDEPTENQKLYIHCNVQACDNRDPGNECTEPLFPGCPTVSARRRRSLEDETKKDATTITIGPVTLGNQEEPVTTCDKEILGCEFDCVRYNDGLESCVCPHSFVLASDGKSCIAVDADNIESNVYDEPAELWLEKDQTSSFVVMMAAGMFVVFATLAVIASVLLKKQNVVVKI